MSITPEQHRQNEAVKAKICEAVPELKRVHEGCYLTGNGHHNTKVLYLHANHPFLFSATVYKNGSGVLENIDFDKKEMKITPRDIRLEDVLVTYYKNCRPAHWENPSPRLSIQDTGLFYFMEYCSTTPEKQPNVEWSLGKSFDDQPQATKDFLASVLLSK